MRSKQGFFFKSAKVTLESKIKQIAHLRAFAAAGIKIHSIYYEDFDEHSERFIRSMMDTLGVDHLERFDPNCEVFKVHKRPIKERITGFDTVYSGVTGYRLRRFENRYNETIREIESLSLQ